MDAITAVLNVHPENLKKDVYRDSIGPILLSKAQLSTDEVERLKGFLGAIPDEKFGSDGLQLGLTQDPNWTTRSLPTHTPPKNNLFLLNAYFQDQNKLLYSVNLTQEYNGLIQTVLHLTKRFASLGLGFTTIRVMLAHQRRQLSHFAGVVMTTTIGDPLGGVGKHLQRP